MTGSDNQFGLRNKKEMFEAAYFLYVCYAIFTVSSLTLCLWSIATVCPLVNTSCQV